MNTFEYPHHWAPAFVAFLQAHANDVQVKRLIRVEQIIRATKPIDTPTEEVERILREAALAVMAETVGIGVLTELPDDLLYNDRPFEHVDVDSGPDSLMSEALKQLIGITTAIDIVFPTHWTHEFTNFARERMNASEIFDLIQHEQELRSGETELGEEYNNLPHNQRIEALLNLHVEQTLEDAADVLIPRPIVDYGMPFDKVVLPSANVTVDYDAATDAPGAVEETAVVSVPDEWTEEFLQFIERKFGEAGLNRAIVLDSRVREDLAEAAQTEVANLADHYPESYIELEILRRLMLSEQVTVEGDNGGVKVDVMAELAAAPIASPEAVLTDSPATLSPEEAARTIEQPVGAQPTLETFGSEVEEAGAPRVHEPFDPSKVGHTQEDVLRGQAFRQPTLEERVGQLEAMVFGPHRVGGRGVRPGMQGRQQWFNERALNPATWGADSAGRPTSAFGMPHNWGRYGSRVSPELQRELQLLSELAAEAKNAVADVERSSERFKYGPQEYALSLVALLSASFQRLTQLGITTRHPYYSHVLACEVDVRGAVNELLFG